MAALGEDDDSPTAVVGLSPQEIVDYLHEKEIEDQQKAKGKGILPEDDIDDTVGYCGECKNIQSDQHMIRSPFWGTGAAVPCQYCGGVTFVIRQRDLNPTFNEHLDRSRGLGSTKQPGSPD